MNQNAGQGCISLEVAYVVEAVHDAFVAKITALARQVRVGSDDDAQMGPARRSTLRHAPWPGRRCGAGCCSWRASLPNGAAGTR
jgi:hypothetical protein